MLKACNRAISYRITFQFLFFLHTIVLQFRTSKDVYVFVPRLKMTSWTTETVAHNIMTFKVLDWNVEIFLLVI